MIGLLVLLMIAVVIGAVLGWVSIFRVNDLRDQIEELRREINYLYASKQSDATVSKPQAPKQQVEVENKDKTTSVGFENPEPVSKVSNLENKPQSEVKKEPGVFDLFVESLRKDWMVWLGGICVGLSGIFLVKYSIEQGLLGPVARIVLALVTGISFHALADWLRRNASEYHQSFAALAGGASIILYAAILASLHLYQLVNPMLAFVLLACVSIATMFLALLHGPVLAIIGILGAYFVPALVSTGSGNILIALGYVLVITASALGLMRYVYRSWLWYGTLAGALVWWWISLTYSDADVLRGVYLALLAYMICAIPLSDWILNKRIELEPSSDTQTDPIFIGLLFIIFAQAISIISEGFNSFAVLSWAPLVIVLFLACRYRDALAKLPWVSIAAACAAWLVVGLDNVEGKDGLFGIGELHETEFLYFALMMSLIYSVFSLACHRLSQFKNLYSSLAALAPVCWLSLSYLLVSSVSSSLTWALGSAALGALYIAYSVSRLSKDDGDEISIWLILGGHIAYSLAVAIFFEEAGLTLALSAQILTIAWIIKRFEMQSLSWLLKLVVAVVICRLTLNPWLPEYQAGEHWTLWTYGGATIFSALAAQQLQGFANLRKWAEAATLHLMVLTIWSETRYWLYDGDVFSEQYGFAEAAINTNLWVALALLYNWRGQISEHLKVFYKYASKLLIFGSFVNYFVLVTIQNPLWVDQQLSSTPIWNLLLLAYGLPVFMGLLVARFYDVEYKKIALAFSGVALFIFVSLQIRHIWQDGTLLLSKPTSNGELYTYSIVWLLIAAASIFLGGIRFGKPVYKAGMILLAFVIAKIFLVDMSDLTGLLRVASFMGLGISLLALAYMHQKFDLANSNPK